MANYVLLYYGGAMGATEAERQAILQAWGAWYGKLGSAVVDGGNPFRDQVKSIASDGQVSNGPVGSMVTGYSIIKANSLDSAAEMAQGCPVLQGGGQIAVYETFQVM